MSPWAVALLAAAATAAWVPPARGRPSILVPGAVPGGATGAAEPAAAQGWMRRHRWLLALCAAAVGPTVVGGATGAVAGPVLAVVVWVVVGRSEPPALRRRREQVRRDLPHLVGLLAVALRAGAAPGDAVAVAGAALPGAAADHLLALTSRLGLGVDPGAVWHDVAGDPLLAPLGRALARAHTSGSSVVEAVEDLADALAREAGADAEDLARSVGVRAAVPLGVCLLPAFVLVGIVPLAAGLMRTLL
ncbi:MAG: type II secretion system F family protein [Nocardioides marinisabuli]|uniref:type II secretion system F family protein n=1 Tax=Nocardioides marinisabuli TaxID=419476 RepID=UPI0032196BCE